MEPLLASGTRRAAGLVLACVFSLAGLGCPGTEPTPGVWSYDETGASMNSCNYDGVVSNGGGSFRLVAEGDGYRIQPEDGSAPFTCSLSGDELDCPDRAAVEEELSGLDAKLVIHVVASATVDSDSELSGTQTGSVTCVGEDCAAVAATVGASLPCDFSVDFRARLLRAE